MEGIVKAQAPTPNSVSERISSLEGAWQAQMPTLTSSLTSVQDQQSVMMRSHTGPHEEVRALDAAVKTSTKPHFKDDLMEKYLLPGDYGGAQDEWRQWGHKVMNFLEKTYPGMTKVMEKASLKTIPSRIRSSTPWGCQPRCSLHWPVS